MDEEMQFPDAEELEWLETGFLFPEYEEEKELVVNAEDRIIEDGCFQAPIRQSPHPRDAKEPGKRAWSEKECLKDCREVSYEEGVTKRRALDKVEEEEHDEHWLPYPQSLPNGANIQSASDNDHQMEESPLVEKILSRFAIDIEGDCIPVTGPSGDRVYAKLQCKEMASRGLKNLGIEERRDGLISEPIDAIIAKLDHEAFAKVFEGDDLLPSCPTIISEQLWVDKYAPCSFTELLSDEETNREVLLWLKQWDSCVFGCQVRATTDDVLSALRSHSSNVQHQKFSDRSSLFGKARRDHFSCQKLKSPNPFDREGKNFNGASESWNKKTMFDQPPAQKVLLLCGPPGLGKTTLAHVAAKHCGYRVVEINASDDRSSAAIESKILDAVQMNSISDSKPKCLVIDEIDGSLGEGKGAVEVILKMVAAGKKVNAEKVNPTENVASWNSSKKGPKPSTLLRPVICICNDLYAPALRPIRQIAKVHMFMQPSVSRVVNRLKFICKKEGFKTNSIALATLAEYTECDVRSCLNTLQFLNRKKETLNILEVGSQVVGRKDVSRSCFDIWRTIFHNRKQKCGKKLEHDVRGHGDFDFMYSVLSKRGDYDLTFDGIHENFLGVCYHDPMMLKTVKCLDVLGASDWLHKSIMQNQRMALHGYQPLLAIIISRLIARVEKPNIEWPKSLHRCRAMFLEKAELLKVWQNRIPPNVSRHLSTEYFSEDFVSHFLHILAPLTLRPVSLHLFSEREKEDLAQLVDTMVSYSLTYKSSKAENLLGPYKHGSFDVPILSLEPPIDDFINYKDYKPAHLELSVAMKQILLHEVEKQKILRESSGRSRLNLMDQNVNHGQTLTVANSEVRHEVHTSNPIYDKGSRESTGTILKKHMGDGNNSSSKLIKGISNSTHSNKPNPCTNFFNRFKVGSSIDPRNVADSLQKQASAEGDSRPFLFKFNEGFTNAVKRPVKVRELLP